MNEFWLFDLKGGDVSFNRTFMSNRDIAQGTKLNDHCPTYYTLYPCQCMMYKLIHIYNLYFKKTKKYICKRISLSPW